GRALAALPRRWELPVLARRACGRRRLLPARARVHVAARERARPPLRLRRLPVRARRHLLHPIGGRREHRAAAVRSDPARRADPLAAAVEAAPTGTRRARARALVEP